MAGLVPAISVSDALSGIEIPGTRAGDDRLSRSFGQPLRMT
jgi:hypothetical protein